MPKESLSLRCWAVIASVACEFMTRRGHAPSSVMRAIWRARKERPGSASTTPLTRPPKRVAIPPFRSTRAASPFVSRARPTAAFDAASGPLGSSVMASGGGGLIDSVSALSGKVPSRSCPRSCTNPSRSKWRASRAVNSAAVSSTIRSSQPRERSVVGPVERGSPRTS